MEEKSSEVVLKDSERQKCEVWTRVMGYHRPVQSFNKARSANFSSASSSRKSTAVLPVRLKRRMPEGRRHDA